MKTMAHSYGDIHSCKLNKCVTLVKEATESEGAALLNWCDFLLQKLQSYGEFLNLRGAMAPLPLYFYFLWCVWVIRRQCLHQMTLQGTFSSCYDYKIYKVIGLNHETLNTHVKYLLKQPTYSLHSSQLCKHSIKKCQSIVTHTHACTHTHRSN